MVNKKKLVINFKVKKKNKLILEFDEVHILCAALESIIFEGLKDVAAKKGIKKIVRQFNKIKGEGEFILKIV